MPLKVMLSSVRRGLADVRDATAATSDAPIARVRMGQLSVGSRCTGPPLTCGERQAHRGRAVRNGQHRDVVEPDHDRRVLRARATTTGAPFPARLAPPAHATLAAHSVCQSLLMTTPSAEFPGTLTPRWSDFLTRDTAGGYQVLTSGIRAK